MHVLKIIQFFFRKVNRWHSNACVSQTSDLCHFCDLACRLRGPSYYAVLCVLGLTCTLSAVKAKMARNMISHIVPFSQPVIRASSHLADLFFFFTSQRQLINNVGLTFSKALFVVFLATQPPSTAVVGLARLSKLSVCPCVLCVLKAKIEYQHAETYLSNFCQVSRLIAGHH